MRRILISLALSSLVALFLFVGVLDGFGITGARTSNVAFASHSVGYAVPTCTGFLHQGPYLNIVATGECELEAGSTVNGKVTVKPGGSFIAENSTINGKLRSNKAGRNPPSTGVSIKLTNMIITGDVIIKKSTGPVDIAGTTFLKKLHVDRGLKTVTIDGGSTGKDLKVTRNVGQVDVLNLNTVGRNLDASRNGIVFITSNFIDKDLKCKKNASVTVSSNTVSGKRTGQCKL